MAHKQSDARIGAGLFTGDETLASPDERIQLIDGAVSFDAE